MIEKYKFVLLGYSNGESLTITVGEYTFAGPYISPDSLTNQGGVYAIHCYRNEKYYLIDVGESGDIKDRVKNHDRKDCWDSECSGSLRYSELLTPRKDQKARVAIEKSIRDAYDPPCGKE